MFGWPMRKGKRHLFLTKIPHEQEEETDFVLLLLAGKEFPLGALTLLYFCSFGQRFSLHYIMMNGFGAIFGGPTKAFCRNPLVTFEWCMHIRDWKRDFAEFSGPLYIHT